MGAVVCFSMAAINVMLAVSVPQAKFNWFAAVFCFGCGIVCAVIDYAN